MDYPNWGSTEVVRFKNIQALSHVYELENMNDKTEYLKKYQKNWDSVEKAKEIKPSHQFPLPKLGASFVGESV